MSLITYPPAPAKIASVIACSSVYDVNIKQFNPGNIERNSRHNSTPLPSGKRTSNTATSGRNAGTRANASATEPACPITDKSTSSSRRSATPRRTTSWSSTKTTVITCASRRVPSSISPGYDPPVPATQRKQPAVTPRHDSGGRYQRVFRQHPCGHMVTFGPGARKPGRPYLEPRARLAAREVVMERLTPLAAAFLDAEDEDTAASLAIGSLAVFQGPAPSFEEFVTTIEGRLPLVPRYRQKLRSVPWDLAPPAWVDAPDFDVRWHVRNTALPAPGGRTEIGQLMSRVMVQRMDRSRPLWECWFCEGLADGRWAVLSKVHHRMVDGVSATDLSRLILAAPPEPSPPVADDWLPAPPQPGGSF